MPLPTLVRSGRANATFIEVDVTGGRTLFVNRNQASTSLTSNNAGVTLLVADTLAPRRQSIWRVAEGTTGTVRITGSSMALWGWSLIDWPAQEGAAEHMGNANTTADMGSINLTISAPAQVAAYWNANNSANWAVPPTGWTSLETITTQNAEPSWTLQCSDTDMAAGVFATPTMSRGKEGTARIEGISAASLIEPVAGSSGRPKTYLAGAWTAKPGKVWTGVAWVEKPWKTWTGTQWEKVT